MRKFVSIVTLGVVLAGSAFALVGCNTSTGTPDKMSGNQRMGTDKMTDDKMGGDKMTDDKMGTDKMGGDKMATDKMGTDKMGGDKMANGKM